MVSGIEIERERAERQKMGKLARVKTLVNYLGSRHNRGMMVRSRACHLH